MRGNSLVQFLEGLEAVTPPGYSAREWRQRHSLTRPWKKGHHYGTILVDLEKRRVVQLLADRSVETSKAWLRKHPEIDLV